MLIVDGEGAITLFTQSLGHLSNSQCLYKRRDNNQCCMFAYLRLVLLMSFFFVMCGNYGKATYIFNTYYKRAHTEDMMCFATCCSFSTTLQHNLMLAFANAFWWFIHLKIYIKLGIKVIFHRSTCTISLR